MSKATPDRAAASALNPLVSPLWTEETLDTVAAVVTDLGYFLSIVAEENAKADTLRFGQLYHLFNTVAAALEYESANVRSAAWPEAKSGGKVTALKAKAVPPLKIDGEDIPG